MKFSQMPCAMVKGLFLHLGPGMVILENEHRPFGIQVSSRPGVGGFGRLSKGAFRMAGLEKHGEGFFSAFCSGYRAEHNEFRMRSIGMISFCFGTPGYFSPAESGRPKSTQNSLSVPQCHSYVTFLADAHLKMELEKGMNTPPLPFRYGDASQTLK